MGEQRQEPMAMDPLEDFFDPALGEGLDDEVDKMLPAGSDKADLALKRRRAEQRLEEKRLRDELGYDDLQLDEF